VIAHLERTSVGLFAYRLVGAALLDRSVYEGIEADRSATRQAMAAVILSSVAAGVGASGWRGPDPLALLLVTAVALVTWVAWATLMFQIGARLLPAPSTRTSLGELLRTIGFAAAPGLLQVFAAFPRVTTPIYVIAWVWIFAATVVAVRQALDYGSTARTLAVCALAAVLTAGMAIVIGVLFAPAVS
jgi:hypothetical protein